jgi:PRTRC genetic system ThiF family protein
MKKKKAEALSFDSDAGRAVPVHLGDYQRIQLLLVGCGGTGSWLAPAVARLARVLRDERQREVSVTFMDPDVVEARNTVRQNFCAAEVGRPKALALASRYSAAWGLEIEALRQSFSGHLPRPPNGHWVDRVVLIGCVDNAAARQALHDALEPRSYKGLPHVWWLDCGNGYRGGQVLLGSARKPVELARAFRLPTICTALPSPGWQRPELLTPAPDEQTSDCTEITRLNTQSLTVNQVIASVAADYLNGLLLGGLRCFATYVSLQAKTMRSHYVTPAAVMGIAGAHAHRKRSPCNGRSAGARVVD